MTTNNEKPTLSTRVIKKNLSELNQIELRQLIAVLMSITSGSERKLHRPRINWYLDFRIYNVNKSHWVRENWHFLLNTPLKVIEIAAGLLKDNSVEDSSGITIWQILDYVEALGFFHIYSSWSCQNYFQFTRWIEGHTCNLRALSFKDAYKDGKVAIQGPTKVHFIKSSEDSDRATIFQAFVSELKIKRIWNDDLKNMIVAFVEQEQTMRFVKQD